jgi:hypothetical protein
MAKSITKISQERVKRELGVFHFKYLSDAIFENAINAVGNPGQAFIIIELKQKSYEPMLRLILSTTREPSKGFFRSLFFVSIGEEKYNAISKIIEEMILQLIEAWDDSTLRDSRTGVRIFLNTDASQYMTNGINLKGQMWAMRAKIVSGLL